MHEIKVSITPVCTCCGADLPTGGSISDPSRQMGTFDRDAPWERTKQRVFVGSCIKCYVFAQDFDALRDALAKQPNVEPHRMNRA
jgi:hypothetical protein